jgi:hypothetical protein
MSAVRLIAALLLAGGCSFDPSGTLGGDGGEVDGAAAAIDAPQIVTGGDDVGADAGPPAPEDAAPEPDAAPPDAGRDDEEEDDCGGFGQTCCEEGDACGPLLFCAGGTCL